MRKQLQRSVILMLGLLLFLGMASTFFLERQIAPAESGDNLVLLNEIELLMYVISVIFIFVVIIMTGSKILYKEQHDLGIYKSLGFSAGNLRLMFALRFGIAAAAGSVLGVILSALLTDSIVGTFLKICGIYNFSSHLNPLRMGLPAIQVTLLFVLFAYLTSGKIKRVDPKILITE